MANFTTESNTYCFRIGPAFLDTIIVIIIVMKSGAPLLGLAKSIYYSLLYW